MKLNVSLIMKRFFVVACMGLALSLSALAQTPAQAPSQPPAKSSSANSASATLSADQILNRYVEAVGGRAAWQKLTSRVSKGTIEVPAMNFSGTIEVHEKAPNRMLAVVIVAGAAFQQGYDGTTGWSDDPENGLREQTGAELGETRRDADFYRPLDLHDLYSKFVVAGTEKIGDRDTYVIEATPAEGTADKMYFDNQTGLLLRVISDHHTPNGVVSFQDDLEDYREVDGIKLPFTINQSSADSAFTIKYAEIHHNVPLADSQFAKPAAE